MSHELHITYYYNQRGPNHNQRNGRVGGKWVKWRERDTFLISTQRRASREKEKKLYIFLMKIAEMENSLIINLWNTSHFSFPFPWATHLLPSDRHHRYWWCSMLCCIFTQAPRLPKGHRLNFYTLNKRTKTLIITELVENSWKNGLAEYCERICYALGMFTFLALLNVKLLKTFKF